jgi:hypothetical protein
VAREGGDAEESVADGEEKKKQIHSVRVASRRVASRRREREILGRRAARSPSAAKDARSTVHRLLSL